VSLSLVLTRLLALFLSAFFCALLLWGLLPFLNHRLLDQPNARSSHKKPTPRGGGVAFVLFAVLASAAVLPMVQPPSATALARLSLLALPLAVLGFLDDRHDLSAGLRYGVQLATAMLMIMASSLTLPWWALPVLVIAVTAVVNFTNFMDGLDGIVAGCMAVAISALAIKLSAPWPLWSLVGALLGFLFWNWNPAKVFMGDVGSTFLGALFAGLVLQASTWPEALGLLLVATPLLGDACLCVPRRLLVGMNVFQAHRLHLFQRLHQAGWSHARVSILYITATAVLAIALLFGGLSWVITLAAVELIIGFWLDKNVAVPFAVAS